MEQKGVQLDRETFSCSICLDLLKDPVAIPCGHSYCMNCIKAHWEEEDGKKLLSCPQCRQTFTSRPILLKNTMLAVLVEQLKKTGLQDAPAHHCYAGAEDVACDVCTGRRLKAFKSCLVCLASYCEKHLQRHYDAPPLKKHKLVEPSNKLQENICSRHDEVMKIFCRTDQQCICYLCSLDEHKGHDTVSAAAERTERQRELEGSRLNIQQRIQDREKDLKLLHQEVEALNLSADKTVEDSEKIFTELIRLMENRSSDVKQQVRSRQRTEVSRVQELQEKLEQEIIELKRNEAELKLLSHTEDLKQFLLHYPSLSPRAESTHSPGIDIRPLRHFEDVTAAVSEVRDKLQDVLGDKWTNVSLAVTEVDDLLSPSQAEPETRAGFLRYSCDITLDPNTANTELLLSDGNRKATVMSEEVGDEEEEGVWEVGDEAEEEGVCEVGDEEEEEEGVCEVGDEEEEEEGICEVGNVEEEEEGVCKVGEDEEVEEGVWEVGDEEEEGVWEVGDEEEEGVWEVGDEEEEGVWERERTSPGRPRTIMGALGPGPATRGGTSRGTGDGPGAVHCVDPDEAGGRERRGRQGRAKYGIRSCQQPAADQDIGDRGTRRTDRTGTSGAGLEPGTAAGTNIGAQGSAGWAAAEHGDRTVWNPDSGRNIGLEPERNTDDSDMEHGLEREHDRLEHRGIGTYGRPGRDGTPGLSSTRPGVERTPMLWRCTS
ncbi:E3 ubiquitin-protein ligase TRIM11-like [Pseudoliparis swirei]|uniref:E3 ubiquitin-protein ligase TRIM11-like n=1 Tax=Pseudoliparis swirei TaxID=2059687 RepID=UPI0024BE6673|nr:E3 ubiquitin-protein ligase TRIM11-like [Pseudoliparis swirei]